jgi:hypothetical protein
VSRPRVSPDTRPCGRRSARPVEAWASVGAAC